MIEIETGKNPVASVIWLHGLGADGHDFEPIVPELTLPAPVRFVFPHAPVRPVTINNGVQVNVQGPAPAQVFTNVPNYTGSGGNGSTTGTFTGQGATTAPLGGQPGF